MLCGVVIPMITFSYDVKDALNKVFFNICFHVIKKKNFVYSDSLASLLVFLTFSLEMKYDKRVPFGYNQANIII